MTSIAPEVYPPTYQIPGVLLAFSPVPDIPGKERNRMSPRARRQPKNASIPQAPTEPIATTSAPQTPESRMSRISERAYAIYERRGGQGGQDMDDWLQAEREIDGEA
jgi:hypothetical protein